MLSPGLTAREREIWIASAIKDGSIETPCLVFDLNAVDRILELFALHLGEIDLFYSVKANNDPTILSHLIKRGIGFDIASVNELASVLALGASAENLILSNTIKTRKCIREIFSRRVAATTVDNALDLKALVDESTFHTFRPGVFARIKVNPVDAQIDLNEKFGCTEEVAVNLLHASSVQGLPPLGVHFHVGTQSWNVEAYRSGLRSAISVLGSLRLQHGLSLNTINIGGGFPDELKAEKACGIENFFVELGHVVREAQDLGYRIVAEPGRVLASGACTAVSQIIGKNSRDGNEWLYLDDGIYGLFSTAHFEQRAFEFVPLGAKKGEPKAFVVAGPTCDSLDVIARGAILPADLQPGDYLIAHHAGAYSISVKSHFNGMAQISTAVSNHAVAQVTLE